jgi:hypothetical protein
MLQSKLAHCLSKLWFRLSNWNCDFVSQITNKESCTRYYATLLKDLTEAQVPPTSEATHLEPNPEDGEDGHYKPGDCYWMSKKHATSRNLTEWLIENKTDRALHVSVKYIHFYQMLIQAFH